MAKILKQKDINLLLALEKGGSSSAEAQKKKKILIILGAVILIIAVLAGLYFIKIMDLNNQKETSLSYINDPAVISAYDEASKKKAELTAAEEREQWLQSLLTTIDSYPQMNSKKFSQIYGYAGSRIQISAIEYDNSTGTLHFEAVSNSATGVPIFVAQLRVSGIFDNVTYEGYTNRTTQEVTGTTVNPDGTIVENTLTHNQYAFNVNCLVKAGE